MLCEDVESAVVCILEAFHIKKRKYTQFRRAVSATRFVSQTAKGYK
jgi:hypothetical protein